jgi:aerobic-type carbon monoxide dehydrogenase small subunit (CoxS/CutS family)
MAGPRPIELRVNGRTRRVVAPAERSLLDVLRNELRLTGAKYGCGEGQCGACTVLVDGAAVRSCVRSVGSCAGKEISTIEGLARGGGLHPMQAAFVAEGAMQCGYCTPGMIMAAIALVRAGDAKREDEIAKAMRTNVCRCGTYPRIVAAIRRAAAESER